MSSFEVVDLQSSTATRGATATKALGRADTKEMAAQLEQLRNDLDVLFADGHGLGLHSIVIKLTITAEGQIAFIAKGSAEASIEVSFERHNQSSS